MSRPDITKRLKQAVMQHFFQLGASILEEFTLKTDRRVDIICLDRNKKIIVIEVKSSKEDFRSDQKWPEYLEWADQFYFAVFEGFDVSILPQREDCGIIISDGFNCIIERQAALNPLKPARKQALIHRLARHAMDRASGMSMHMPGI